MRRFASYARHGATTVYDDEDIVAPKHLPAGSVRYIKIATEQFRTYLIIQRSNHLTS